MRQDGNDGWITQDLRRFTVEIRSSAAPSTSFGSGIVVTPGGDVVTCAHVVANMGINPYLSSFDAGGVKAGEASDRRLARLSRTRHGEAEIKVHLHAYPRAGRQEARVFRAYIKATFGPEEEDLVLLGLKDRGEHAFAPEDIAVLGPASESVGHVFASFGYRSTGKLVGLHAKGEIVGLIEAVNRHFRREIVQLESHMIGPGMSGAPVLDQSANLVIGVVTQAYVNPGGTDRDTSFACDTEALSLAPFSLPISQRLPQITGPRPPGSIVSDAPIAKHEVARVVTNGEAIDLDTWLDHARLTEWVGRREYLKALTTIGADPECRVIGIVGFGGEGKTTAARRWIADGMSAGRQPSLFWWSFYDRPHADDFIESALVFANGGDVGVLERLHTQTAASQARMLVAQLNRGGQYLFVLDGLEVLQFEGGDEDGLVAHDDLRLWLELFAAPTHQSTCVVTSRTGVRDLENFRTYRELPLGRMSTTDGIELLRKLGIRRGNDAELGELTDNWDGHALTLTLLGSLLVAEYNGDIRRTGEMPAPAEYGTPYQGVQRVLRWYDQVLPDDERRLLIGLSVFRTPVMLDTLIETMSARSASTLGGLLNPSMLGALADSLARRRILAVEPSTETTRYTVHALVRQHYSQLLAQRGAADRTAAHRFARDYYLTLAEHRSNDTIEDLVPLIEAFYHARLNGEFDDAFDIYRKIDEPLEAIGGVSGPRRHGRVLTWQLGAYGTDLDLVTQFFPNADLSRLPLVANDHAKAYLVNEAGLCLMTLGKLDTARTVFTQSAQLARRLDDAEAYSKTMSNLAELHIHSGRLDEAQHAAREALAAVHDTDFLRRRCIALAYLAWSQHLRGETTLAAQTFEAARAANHQYDSTQPYLTDLWGAWWIQHLMETGNIQLAWTAAQANLRATTGDGYTEAISQANRVLGDLAVADGLPGESIRYHAESVRLARRISHVQILIEALLGRGQAALATDDTTQAYEDLGKALDLARRHGYVIFETTARLGLGQTYFARGYTSAARDEASAARTLALNIGLPDAVEAADTLLGRITEQG